MIAGYFLYNPDRVTVSKKLPGKILKILLYAVVYFVLYALYTIVRSLISGDGIMTALSEIFPLSPGYWIKFILLNNPFCVPSWYLWAMVYCYIVMWFINHFNLYKIAYCFIPILLILYLIIAYTSNVVFPIYDVEYNAAYVRNWLFDGMPWVLLGNFLAKYHDRIVGVFSNKICIALMIVSVLLCIVERIILYNFGLGTVGRTIFVSPYATFMFILAMKNPKRLICKPIAYIGLRLSLIVYIIHSLVGGIFTSFVGKFLTGISGSLIYQWVMPVIVAILTLLSAYILVKIKDILHKHIKTRVDSV